MHKRPQQPASRYASYRRQRALAGLPRRWGESWCGFRKRRAIERTEPGSWRAEIENSPEWGNYFPMVGVRWVSIKSTVSQWISVLQNWTVEMKQFHSRKGNKGISHLRRETMHSAWSFMKNTGETRKEKLGEEEKLTRAVYMLSQLWCLRPKGILFSSLLRSTSPASTTNHFRNRVRFQVDKIDALTAFNPI